MNSPTLNHFGREPCREQRQTDRREWRLNPYALAEYRVSRDIDKALSRLKSIRDHLFDADLGSVPVREISDADPPHGPSGAKAQAWPVACILEVWRRLSTEKAKISGYMP